jgi:hypothetical protein
MLYPESAVINRVFLPRQNPGRNLHIISLGWRKMGI